MFALAAGVPARSTGNASDERTGMLWRALRRRCPLCGHRAIFRTWGQLTERCPGCGYSFEREEGYWVGAMIVNVGAAQGLFFALFIGGLWLTWPDVPWAGLLVVCLLVMAGFPVWFYPRSKTLWVWLDLLVHPYTEDRFDGA
jgi:uncharacterized protein (DUF983 family)